MMVQHLKRRPLSRYLKDFKHSQTHCAHCRKLLDRITLVRDGKIVNKIEISRLDTLLDENGWQVEQQSWAALCRFCGDLHCKTQSDFFDIIGFKQFLFEQTEMSPGTVREYVVRLCRKRETIRYAATGSPHQKTLRLMWNDGPSAQVFRMPSPAWE